MMARKWRVARSAAAILAVAATSCSSGAGGPAITPTREPSLSAQQAAVIRVGRRPTQVAFGGGYAWVGNSGDGTISQIDPRTNRLVTTFKIGDTGVRRSQGCEPYDVHGMPDGSFVTRRCDVPSAVIFAAGSLWATRDENRSLLRIDPTTRKVTHEIPLEVSPFAMGAGADSIWVSDYEHGAVAHVDISSNKLAGVIRGLAGGPSGVAVAAGSAWVVNRSLDGVTRIDAVSNRVSTFIPLGQGPLAIIATAEAVYVKEEIQGEIARIDPGSNRILARIPVGPKEGRDGVDSIALDGASLWVTGMHLQRIDTRTNAVAAEFAQDATTVNVDGAGDVWVTNNVGDVVRTRSLAAVK